MRVESSPRMVFTMRAFASVICLVLVVVGHASVVAQDAKDDPDLPQVDTTDTTIKSYTDGKSLAPCAVAIHKDPKPGQYWEVGSDSFDIKTTNRWQVSRIDGDVALLEQRVSMSAEMFKSAYVLGYRVDLKPERGAPSVTKAWIGKPGGKPQVIQIAKMPAVEAPDTEAEDDTPKDEGQPFEALELAGTTWKGRLYTHEFDDMTTKIWVVENGWFDRIAKTTAGDEFEQKLQSFGYDAEPLMLWPEDWQDAGDEEKSDPEAGKDDDKDNPSEEPPKQD